MENNLIEYKTLPPDTIGSEFNVSAVSTGFLNLAVNFSSVAFSEQGVTIFLSQTGMTNYLRAFNSISNYNNKKEDFYITAIRNLRKKIRFMNLNFDYQNDDITEQEFEQELKDNQSKYFVNISLLKDEVDLSIIREIVGKIDDNLTINDISDIFSIDINTNQNLTEAPTQ